MRQINAIERQQGLSCATCELTEYCKEYKQADPDKHSNSICKNFGNDRLGYFYDQIRSKRIVER